MCSKVAWRCKRGYDESVVISTRLDRAGVGGLYAYICLIAAAVASAAAPANAQVRDAVYRGTMVCDKLPFTAGKSREAIEVTSAGDTVRYSRVVRLRGTASLPREEGSGTLSGQNISLQAHGRAATANMKRNMRALFLRRHADLKGTQIWNDDGKSISRDCSGTIKRQLRVFLPRDRKQP
jgi:hypothetical protein